MKRFKFTYKISMILGIIFLMFLLQSEAMEISNGKDVVDINYENSESI